jgi:membrane dipeptidase
VIAVFDGHNDALTRSDHARLVDGRDGGHLDLPRMRAGGMRGGIFAVFVDYGPEPMDARVPRSDDVIEWEYAPPIGHELAAAGAAAAAGRLLALERAGHVIVAREVGDVDAARDGDGPPAAVLHLEGVEAIDPGLESLELR